MHNDCSINVIHNSIGSLGQERREERTGKVSLGLSTSHIRTQSLSCGMFWAGGLLLKVNRNSETSPAKGGGLRGKIEGFSKGSRRRLQVMLAKLDRSKLPIFVTLTFPDEWYENRIDIEKSKGCLVRFTKRLKRRFPDSSFIWRLEGEIRKSGRYPGAWFPHFHLMVWGCSWEELLAFVGQSWYESCGELSEAHKKAGTRSEWIRSYKGIMSYASKYMSKKANYPVGPGRVWGVVNPAGLPWVKAILCQLEEKEAVQLIRYMRRYAHLRGRDYKSLMIFCDAELWLMNLDKLLYPG